MTVVRIEIKDCGGHWHKKVWVFGIPVYHRHYYSEKPQNRTVGFNVMPYNPVDVDDDNEFMEE